MKPTTASTAPLSLKVEAASPMPSASDLLRTCYTQQRFVLVRTSHPGNVGAAARAIKTMGFGRLVLVQPLQPDIQHDPVALAMASGADDVLAAAQVVDDIDSALFGANLTIALSARAREFAPKLCSPRLAAQRAVQTVQGQQQAEVAWIFGNERFGLPNEIVERCRLLVQIPANPAYSSLNLAQAVQLLAYEAHMACLDTMAGASPLNNNLPDAPVVGFIGESATNEQIEAMFTHLKQALVEINFLDPSHPKKLMSRLRRLFARTELEKEEVNIVRGIARAILLKIKSK